jgi:predicted membrane-bound mannosyltransferase
MNRMLVSGAFGLALVVAGGMPSGVHAATVAKKAPVQKWVSPSVVPGKDEKVAIADPTSKCLTKEMTALHAATVAQMDKDIAAAGDRHASSTEMYREKVDIVWEAMHEPYCGYGSMGMKAVKKSYKKSVERIRQAFLLETKIALAKPKK